MTKEALMEDLVKRAAPSDPASNPAPPPAQDQQVWHEVISGHDFKTFSWTLICTLAAVGSVALILACICFFCRGRHSNGKPKRRPIGIKRAGYFRDRCSQPKPNRNPPPVINPDRGSHYLKKSPSPTGIKSPPSAPLATSGIHLQQGKIRSPTDLLTVESELTPTNEHSTLDLSRRRSSAHRFDDSAVDCGSNETSATGLGKLKATIKYCFDKNALIVTVNSCSNLPAKDSNSKSSDPYVKLQLLPEKQHKVKTRVMRRTLNPVYDEDFTFYGINFNQLPGLTLHFVVLSFDRYSRDDVIGEVMVELDDIEGDLSSSDHVPIKVVRDISPRSLKLKTQGRGEILVSLCYQPAANRITVVVLKARNLPKMDITGLSDPYVKIYLLYNDQRIAKKKTHVKKRTLNPVFNESFVFELPHLDSDADIGLKNISLEFLLLDWDRVTKNEVIGRLDLGASSSSDSGLHHWNEVLTNPRRQIAEWHKLQE